MLDADPAVLVTDQSPDVTVLRGGGAPSAIPFLEVMPDDAQEEAILLHHDAARSSLQVLREGIDRLGLEEIDTMDLAQATGRVIAMGAAPAPLRGIGIWESLLSERYNFIQSRSFPLFVALAIRWLADVPEYPPYIAVGEAVPYPPSAWTDPEGRRLDAAGAGFAPSRAAIYTNRRGEKVAASLLDPVTTAPPESATLRFAVGEGGSGAGLDLVTLFVGAALALLLAEWFLYRTGRMP